MSSRLSGIGNRSVGAGTLSRTRVGLRLTTRPWASGFQIRKAGTVHLSNCEDRVCENGKSFPLGVQDELRLPLCL